MSLHLHKGFCLCYINLYQCCKNYETTVKNPLIVHIVESTVAGRSCCGFQGIGFPIEDNPRCSRSGAINLFSLKWDFQPFNLPIAPLMLNMDYSSTLSLSSGPFILRKVYRRSII